MARGGHRRFLVGWCFSWLVGVGAAMARGHRRFSVGQWSVGQLVGRYGWVAGGVGLSVAGDRRKPGVRAAGADFVLTGVARRG